MKTLKVLLQEVILGIKAWVDTNTVHKSGNETIGGEKTWADTNTFSTTLKQVNSAITKGTNPQSDIGAFNVYWGGTGVSSLTNALFTQRGYVYADGSTSYILYALENVLGGTHTSLSLTYDPNDTINKRYAFMRGDFRPYYDNAFNLGIPTYRWNNLYSTTTNTDTIQSVSGNLVIHSTGTDKGVFIHNGANAGDGGGLFLYGKTHSNGSLVRLQIYNTSTSSYEAIDLASSSFYPYTNNLINLGTSTQKWKTINGINPGALSLPSESPSRTNLDPTNWNTTGTAVNKFTPPTDGWLGVQVQSADTTNLTGQYVFAGRSTGGGTFWPSAQLSNLVGDFESGKLIGCVMIPVIAGKEYHVRIKMGKTLEQGSKIYASFYPCLGNV